MEAWQRQQWLRRCRRLDRLRQSLEDRARKQDRGADGKKRCNGPGRRGRRQDRWRRTERSVRRRAVACVRWLGRRAKKGRPKMTVEEIAVHLGLESRTLRKWQQLWHKKKLPAHRLGRPLARSSRQERSDVLAHLRQRGPEISQRELQQSFLYLPPPELNEMLERFRRLCAKEEDLRRNRLVWKIPGAVWALDLTEDIPLIDGCFPYALAARDLASLYRPIWEPLQSKETQESAIFLREAFDRYGPPLVLKVDHGFQGDILDVLAEYRVVLLLSPGNTPSYNGSIEVSIGTIKKLTRQLADLDGGAWSSDHLVGARLLSNQVTLPNGRFFPSAQEEWAMRPLISESTRLNFLAAVSDKFEKILAERTYYMPEVSPFEEEVSLRKAVTRVLVDQGFLKIRGRRNSLPIINKKPE